MKLTMGQLKAIKRAASRRNSKLSRKVEPARKKSSEDAQNGDEATKKHHLAAVTEE